MGTKVRIIAAVTHEGVEYLPNQVVDIKPALSKSWQGVYSDFTPEAVAYCIKELGAEVITHQASEPENAE